MTDYDFNVVVKDQAGNLVETATVTIYKSDDSVAGTGTTNSSGVLASNITLSDTDNTHLIQVTKTGYTTFTRYYEVYQDDTSYYVRLPSYSNNYCTPSQVSQFMGRGSTGFDNTSTPSDSEVSDIIEMNEQEIDSFLMTSFRANTISNEFHDLSKATRDESGFVPIWPRKRPVQTADSSWAVEVWDGSSYTDYVTSKTEGRANDYYIDYDKNILYIKPDSWGDHALRLTYKWGYSSVPSDVKKLCILKTALNLVDLDDYASLIRESGDNKLSTKRDSYLQQIRMLEKHLTKFKF